MLAYRIAKEKFIRDLSGKGAEMSGGRWNPKGTPALYTSSSLALCMCEVLVHTDRDIPPTDMCFAEIFIPDECISEDYFSCSYLKASLQNGEAWLKGSSSLAIKVPSAILLETYAGDFNIIINPLHTDFSAVKIIKTEPCSFDSRLF